MSGRRAELIERIERLVDPSKRLHWMGVVWDVVKRGADDKPVVSRSIDRVFGGMWDTMLHRYVPCDLEPHHLQLHEHQARMFEAVMFGEKVNVIGRGSPGGGKTMSVVMSCVAFALTHPGKQIGFVAPTSARLDIGWREIMKVCRPLGLVADTRLAAGEIELWNGCVIKFVAAKQADERLGTPLAGYTWAGAFADETQSIGDTEINEIEFRGREVGLDYRFACSATNARHAEFVARMARQLADTTTYEVIVYKGKDNAFTSSQYWESLKLKMSARDYARLVENEEYRPEHVMFPSFDYARQVKPLPDWEDITSQVIEDAFGWRGRRFLVGQDFGVGTNVSLVLRCLKDPSNGLRTWWAIKELATRQTTTLRHGQELRQIIVPDSCLVLNDPHPNQYSKDDLSIMQGLGFAIDLGGPKDMKIRDKIAVIDALCLDAHGRTRLFIATESPSGKATCPKLCESLLTSEATDVIKKDAKDVSHWYDALAHGVYTFERPLVYVDGDHVQ